MPQDITEQFTLEAATTDSDGSLLVEFITPGWGSSGYYSPEVVEAAAPLFALGTHMYLDHPTAAEQQERPVRSVKDLAAVITEAGVYTDGGIRGKVKPFGPYRDLLLDEDFAKNIGLSIRASASDIVVGEAEGRRGPIIESLTHLASVDFVTRAGRGGRVLQVLESASPDEVVARAVAHGIEEATADERRTQLSDAVRSAYAGTNSYAWVQDFDDTTVWFQASADNERSRFWEQAYTVADSDLAVTLTGDRTEVRQVTRYLPITAPIVPATRPDSTTTTEESKEDPMAEVTIEEAELARLRDDAGRVQTLESERDTARTDLAIERRTNRARTIVAEADASFTPLERRGLLADLPVNEDGTLDEAAFTTTVTEAAAASAAARGAGSVRGFGGTTQHGQDDLSEAELDKRVAGAFGRTVKEA